MIFSVRVPRLYSANGRRCACSIQRPLVELWEKVAGLRSEKKEGSEKLVSKAVQLLIDHDNSALPVIDGDRRVIGILSEAD